ncbi:hypothetical protein LTS03_011278 [Exophiala xenobiotica]|nr:hypothetical protein LTS03_011278 [Exophiala xenobiotica]KAK5474412.1 hypothetical protein LTR55_009909 [Exophiala xenobiotica]
MEDRLAARRQAEQDRLREKRNFRHWESQATDTIVLKPIKPKTENSYNRMLDAWDNARRRRTSPFHLKTLKQFLKWYCDGRKGRIPADDDDEDEDDNEGDDDADREPRMTQDSVYTCWKSFMSGWQRRETTTFPKHIQTTVETLIYGGDNNYLNLRTVQRPARNFTVIDYKVCVGQLWGNDWHDFHCELYRVLLHLMQLLHANTSARTAEYDTAIYQVWFEDKSQPQIIIDLCRNHTKGLANLPQHLLYELVDQPFYYNTVGFFVSPILALGGLRDFETWQDICAIQKPGGREWVPLHYKEDLLKRPVFPRHASPWEPATSIVNALGHLGQRAGFRDRPTPGAIRREGLLKVDMHGYSINERMRHADHINPNTYGGFYQSGISTVDGQATFFGLEKQGTKLHEMFRGFSIHRIHNYNPELPQNLHAKLGRHVSEAMKDPALHEDSSGPGVGQKVYEKKRQHKASLLQRQRLSFFDDWTSPYPKLPYESDFQQTRKLMPERDRLASTLFMSGSLRDTNGCRVMQDLVALCSSQNSDTFCHSLNGSRTECLTCGLARTSSNYNWWYHLYSCRKKQSAANGRFSEFCFLCFQWLVDAESWHDHASHHLEHVPTLPLKCNLTVFRGNVIRPALCPNCLGNDILTPTERMRQFLNITEWKDHVHRCYPRQGGPFECRHPRCRQVPAFDQNSLFIEHRADLHQTPSPKNDQAKRLEYADKPFYQAKWSTAINSGHPVRLLASRHGSDNFVNYSSTCMKEKIENRRTGKPHNSSAVPERTVEVSSASSQRHRHQSGRAEVSDTDQASSPVLDGIEKGESANVQPPAYSKASVNDVQAPGSYQDRGSVGSTPGRSVARLLGQDISLLEAKSNGVRQSKRLFLAADADQQGTRKKRKCNITIEIPPRPTDWWVWEKLVSPTENRGSTSSSSSRDPPKKRPRGRPRAPTKMDVLDGCALKRPRGRPPGSRNKDRRSN